MITDLQNRGVAEGIPTGKDILIACVDGLTGFHVCVPLGSDAIHSVFPKTQVQRCIIHQIRNSLKYVSSLEEYSCGAKDRKAFVKDLKTIYKAPNRETAEKNLLRLNKQWSDKYAIAVRSWENNWDELSTFFDYPAEIRRLIYTTNSIEGYNRQLRKVTKNKASFPTAQAVRKLLYLANVHITKKWTRPIMNWPLALHATGNFKPVGHPL